MSEYARYPEYKDSGVPWLGEIPSHWDTWKITHAIDLIGSGTTPKSDNSAFYEGETLWVTTSELRESIITDTKQKVSKEALSTYSALKVYPKNSVAIAMYGATIGRLGILGAEATFNQACCVFSESDILNHKFLYYWLWHRRPILISLSNGGGQPNLSQDDLKKLKLPLPPLNEQVSIANFLDHELGKIDALIDKQKLLLDKLAEQRSAVITQAVTKGLNPNVEMKDSGVAWLGDVPSHWVVKRLKFLSKYFKGYAFKSGDYSPYEGVPLIKVSNVKKFQVVEIDTFISFDKLQPNFERVRLVKGDLVLSTVGSLPNVVNSAVGQIVSINNQYQGSFLNQNNVCFRVNDLVTSDYISYFVKSAYFRRRLDVLARWIANQAYLEVNDINTIEIIFPKLEEQKEIVNYLDNETQKIDQMTDTVNRTIEQLKEYRSTLITQAVTGKIKVF